ncbi:MAG: tyrosine-type recombinase/integrase, partial [Chloroflexota bacterium]
MDSQLNAFLQFLQTERNYSDNTTAAYRNDLGQFVTWLSAVHTELDSWVNVDYAIVAAYVDHLKEQSYTASSVARKAAAIKSFFHFLLARGLINSDPTAKLESPKVKKRLPQTLTADEVKRLLATPSQKSSPKNLRDNALLHVLYTTGMRVTEAVTLKVDDVKLDASMLLCPSKESKPRELPLDSETRLILADYLDNGRPHLVKDKDVDALFLNHRGQQLTRQGLWLIIKAYANQADLGDKVTP